MQRSVSGCVAQFPKCRNRLGCSLGTDLSNRSHFMFALCPLTTEVATLQQWLEEKLSEGRIPRDELMKAVIAITGEGLKFADKTVPSTKTDLLRRTANQLSIGPCKGSLCSHLPLVTLRCALSRALRCIPRASSSSYQICIAVAAS